MWCIQSDEEPIKLINYDTNETKEIDSSQLSDFSPLEMFKQKDKYYEGTDWSWHYVMSYLPVSRYCYLLLNYIESIEKTTINLGTLKGDGDCNCVALDNLAIADEFGVVWRYGSRYFNLLSILIYVDLNYCNITNCSKLVLYSSKGSSLKYIITFNKPQFKVFFSKLRLKTNNFERGLIL